MRREIGFGFDPTAETAIGWTSRDKPKDKPTHKDLAQSEEIISPIAQVQMQLHALRVQCAAGLHRPFYRDKRRVLLSELKQLQKAGK